MSDLTPISSFDDVVQLETTTIALGGPGGPMNQQAQALLNRTQYLAGQIADLAADIAATYATDADVSAAVSGVVSRLASPVLPADGPGMIAFTPSVNYSLGTLGRKAQQVLCVDDFPGVVGDGVNDDTAGFLLARNSGAFVTLNPAKHYMLSATIAAVSGKNFLFEGPARAMRGGNNNPFPNLPGPIIEWTGANNVPVFEIDLYNSHHTVVSGFSLVLPNTYASNAIQFRGGPYLSQGGIAAVTSERVGVYRKGTISPEATAASLFGIDCTGNLPDGRVGGGWIIRDFFAFNTQNIFKVNIGNNTLGTPGLDNWWNSNLIESGYGYQVYRAIDIVGGTINGNAAWRNVFQNITIQPGLGIGGTFATGVIRGTGLVEYNAFNHVTVWDLSSGSEFVLPERNIRRGYFGDYFSHTEGLLMFGPTAADGIRQKRPGWDNAFRWRAYGNNGDQMMQSNNWDGTARDTTSLHAAATRLYTESSSSQFDVYLGAGTVASRFSVQFDGTNTKMGFFGAVPAVQPTGYGTPTAATKTASLPGTGATLAQVGGTLGALILELKTLGIIGA